LGVTVFLVLRGDRNVAPVGPIVRNPGHDGKAVKQEEEERPAPGELDPAPRTALAQMLDCNMRLAEAEAPGSRVLALADLGGSLEGEVPKTSAAPDRLKTLGPLYRELLQKGLGPLARQLPQEEREPVLAPVVQGLTRFHAQAVLLAPEVPAVRD